MHWQQHVLTLGKGVIGNLHDAEMQAKTFIAFSGQMCQLRVLGDEGNDSLNSYGKEELPGYKN